MKVSLKNGKLLLTKKTGNNYMIKLKKLLSLSCCLLLTCGIYNVSSVTNDLQQKTALPLSDQVKPGKTITLTFSDLPDTLNGDPASCEIRIPENFDSSKPVPMVVWCAGWKGSNKVIGALSLVDRRKTLVVGMPYPSTCRIPRLALEDGKEKQIWEYQSVMLEKIKRLIPNIDPNKRIAVGSSSGAHYVGTALAREWAGFTDYFTAYVLYGGGVAPGTTYPGAKGKQVLMAWGVDSGGAPSRRLFAERMQASGAKVTISEIPNTGHPLSNEARVVIKAWLEDIIK